MENTYTNKEKSDIVILVNGPGELASFVKPAVEALVKRSSAIRIFIVFTPCPYSTGKEEGIARNIPGISRVITKNGFINWAIWRKAPSDIKFSKNGVVVFLGGDILYGKIIAKRLGYPAVAYTEAYAKWPKVYRKFLVPDQFVYDKFKKQGFPEDQLKIVGNLMVDSIKLKKNKGSVFSSNGLDSNKTLISFMPGSREFQIQFTLKFFANVVKNISNLSGNIQFAFIISPYLPAELLSKYIKRAGLTLINGTLRFGDIKINMIENDQHEAIAASDLIITIPGTNTAEVAIIGTPMISVFPLNSSQLIPLEGMHEIIGRLPVLGFFFKRLYVKIMQSKIRFFAIPNIKTGKEIVPELKGYIEPQAVAEKAVSLINNKNKMEEMRRQLMSSLGSPGAADRIAEEILNETLLKTI